MKRELLLAGIIWIILMSNVSAETNYVISNSENWQDAYSTLLYANLQKLGVDFLVSTKHGELLWTGIAKQNEIEVVTSNEKPFVFNYDQRLEDLGFEQAIETTVDNANLELIEKLGNINNFIIIGDYYGYNAMAVAPYAIQTNSWVFIANRENIVEIDNILARRNVGKVLLYGYADREVSERMQKYSPEIINEGDRFEDNIEIVKKYLKINPTTQVLLTNGEFMEKELMLGTFPILFTGKENVPEKIGDYLKSSDFEVGVLIGNDLINAATNIRRDTGISVMVKFARSARQQEGGVAAVENLDLFPLPSPSILLEIHSIKYNRALSQLEVTYRSKSNVPAYLKGTVTLYADGEKPKMGDLEAVFIAPNDFKTVRYTGVIVNSQEGLSADVYTLFGETESSFDRVLQGKFDVSYVNVIDDSAIDICEKCVQYNVPKESFIIKVENIGETGAWVDLELENLIINGVKRNVGSEQAVFIEAGEKKNIIIKQRMDETDISENDYLFIRAYYGQKEDSLVKELQGKFSLNVTSIDLLLYLVVSLLILIIILIIIIWIIKRREERL
jgi:hypothetical protein